MKLKPTMVAEIIDDIRRVFQVVTERSRKVESETGLTASQLWAVKILKESAPMKVSDLAKRMYLHPATMVGILDRLEAKGAVRRTRSSNDRRVVHIDLTDLGLELAKNSPEVVQGLLVRGLEPLSAHELKKILEVLDQIVKLLGAQNIPPKLLLTSDVNLPGGER